jgi:hypothetical protein
MEEELVGQIFEAMISILVSFVSDYFCLRGRIRSFFCHQMRKSYEICENLGFRWLLSLRVGAV